MAGNASELYEYNDFFSNSSNSANLFSAWLFGKINTDCLLADVGQDGCSILIPRKHLPLKDTFNLIIMSPDNNEKIHASLAVKKLWINEYYSPLHIKAGLEFTGIEEDSFEEVKLLITYFISSPNSNIKCSIINK